MEYKVLNPSKMRRFFNDNSGKKITDSEFQDAIDSFIDAAKYIYEVTEEKPRIQEGLSTEIDIGENTYEVWVHYNTIHDNEGEKTLINLDYNHFMET